MANTLSLPLANDQGPTLLVPARWSCTFAHCMATNIVKCASIGVVVSIIFAIASASDEGFLSAGVCWHISLKYMYIVRAFLSGFQGTCWHESQKV